MGMRLDTAGGYSTDGTNLQIYNANGTNSQKFSLYVLQGNGPTALSLSGASSLEVGADMTLSVDYHDATAYKGVTWSSSNSLVAKVENGVVTGTGVGTATITATSTYNDHVKADFNVTVFSSDTEAPVIRSAQVWYQNNEKVIIEAEITDNVGVAYLSPLSATAVQENGNYVLTLASADLKWVSETKVRYTIPYDSNYLAGERHVFFLTAKDAAGNKSETKAVYFDKVMSPVFTMQVGEQRSFNDMVQAGDLSGYHRKLLPDDSIVSVVENGSREKYLITALKPGKTTVVFINIATGKLVSAIVEVKGQGESTMTPVTPTQPANTGMTTVQPSTSTQPSASSAPVQSTVPEDSDTVVLATKLPLQIKQGASLKNLINGDTIVGCSSSNSKVLSVNAAGKITGKKAGKAVVTIQLASGKKVHVTVTVQKKKVTTSKITNLPKAVSLKVKAKKKLSPVLFPITSKDKVTYKTSNKKIVTISSKGVITAKKAGKATITIKAGKKSFKVKVTVKKRAV